MSHPLAQFGGHLGNSRYTSENAPKGLEALRCGALRKKCIEAGYPESWVEGGIPPEGLTPNPNNPVGPWTKDDCLKALGFTSFMPITQTLKNAGKPPTLADLPRTELIRIAHASGLIKSLKTTLPDDEIRARIEKGNKVTDDGDDAPASGKQGAEAGEDHRE